MPPFPSTPAASLRSLQQIWAASNMTLVHRIPQFSSRACNLLWPSQNEHRMQTIIPFPELEMRARSGLDLCTCCQGNDAGRPQHGTPAQQGARCQQAQRARRSHQDSCALQQGQPLQSHGIAMKRSHGKVYTDIMHWSDEVIQCSSVSSPLTLSSQGWPQSPLLCAEATKRCLQPLPSKSTVMQGDGKHTELQEGQWRTCCS